MKIISIRIQEEYFPLRNPFVTALRKVETLHALHVIVETDTGLTGVGSASPVKAITGETAESLKAGIEILASRLIGKSLDDLNGILNELGKMVSIGPGSRASLDMAIHDLFAQSVQTPLYRLLGGYRKRISSDLTISLRSPEQMVLDSVSAVERGFGILKIKLGEDGEKDFIRFKEISHAVNCPLRIDANQGWTVDETLCFMEKCNREGLVVDLLEQPVPRNDLQGMAFIRQRIDCPLAADESVFSSQDALRLAECGGADIVNIKLLKCGGIYEAKKIISIVSSAGLDCMIGCMMESPIGIAAALHLASASPEIRYFDLDLPFLLQEIPREFGVVSEETTLLPSEKAGFYNV